MDLRTRTIDLALDGTLGLRGADSTRMTPIVARLAQLFLKYDLTQADLRSLARLEDGTVSDWQGGGGPIGPGAGRHDGRIAGGRVTAADSI